MDLLEITGLSVGARIGVHPWEQRISQRLLIDVSIPYDFKNCKDDLNHTLDYDTLCQLIIESVEAKIFQLIETVANEVAELVKEKFNVTEITVSVSKPHAIKAASNVKVTVKR